MKNEQIIVIGSGFSGLSAACFLAQKGHKVTVLEKNSTPGGRGRQYKENGYTFDLGPSWYWMPDIFDSFFAKFGKKTSDYYQLVRLDPSYSVFFDKDDRVDIPADMEQMYQLFDSIEPGSSTMLKKFLDEARIKYEIGIGEFVYKPGLSIMELMEFRILKKALKLHMLKSFGKYVHAHFKNPKLRQIVEFPVLFLGATPEDTPALYSMMNYADMVLGTWYPMGGMYTVVEGMVKLAQELGVTFEYDTPVEQIIIENGHATGVRVNGEVRKAQAVVASADYEYVDQNLVAPEYRNYSPSYWDKRKLAPSALLYYVGLNKPVKNLLHHNLLFDRPFAQHAREIYHHPAWPAEPLLYVSCTSKTDPDVAPEGHENMVILIPMAPGLEDNPDIKQKYFDLSIDRIEYLTGESIRPNIDYMRAYGHSDFIADYHAFKGNAYGLANTLGQTHILKPSLKLKKTDNVFFTGQLTVPGPGVPPSLISGEVVAGLVDSSLKG